jgi:hypothetical protein
MTAHLYHFTSSAQFPWIIRSGELRAAIYPGQPRDFVHATDNETGERTAAGWWTWEKSYRAGDIRRVRFTLDAADFEPWRTVYARYPEWTPYKIEQLHDAARSRGQSTAGHYCRAEPLPLAKVIAIDTRAYTGHRWEPFDLSASAVFDIGPNCLGVKLGTKIYPSIREYSPDWHRAFTLCEPVTA